MSIYEHFEHAQNSALHEIRTLVLICQPCIRVYTRKAIINIVYLLNIIQFLYYLITRSLLYSYRRTYFISETPRSPLRFVYNESRLYIRVLFCKNPISIPTAHTD